MRPNWIHVGTPPTPPTTFMDQLCDPRYFLVWTERGQWVRARPTWDHEVPAHLTGWVQFGRDGLELDDVTHWAEGPEGPA